MANTLDRKLGQVEIIDDSGNQLGISSNPITTSATGAGAEDAAASGNPVLSGGRYDNADRTLDDGDAGAIAVNAAGHTIVDTRRNTTLQFAKIDTASSGATEIVAAAGSGLKIKVVSYVFVSTSALTVKWQSASTDLSGAMAVAANGGVSAIGSRDAWLLETAANEALNINLSAGTQVSGHISYYTEA